MRRIPRGLAIAFALVLSLPALPYGQLFGTPDTAAAQVPEQGVLADGVQWHDWQATHTLYAHKLGENGESGQCPPATNPQTGEPLPAPDPNISPGDITCQSPMNTTVPTDPSEQGGTHNVDVVDSDCLTQTTEASTIADSTNGCASATGPSPLHFVRLAPSLVQPVTINSLKAVVWARFSTGLTSCSILADPSDPTRIPGTEDSGQVRLWAEAHLLTSGQNGEDLGGLGQVLGRSFRDVCPVDLQGGGKLDYELDLDIPLSSDDPGVNTIPAGGRIQVIFALGRPQGQGTWLFRYDAAGLASNIQVGSNNAFQYALWMEDQVRTKKATNLFPIPGNEADRFSAIGFFAIKDAWGIYDNPDAMSNPPVPEHDAQWEMSIVGPNNQTVSLSHQQAFHLTDPEFTRCGGAKSNTFTCLIPAGSDSGGIRAWRMPTRPVGQGSSGVWNYTRPEIDAISPGGGEFRLRITGGFRGTHIADQFPEGFRFTVGGFGIIVEPLKSGTFEEKLTHQICVQTSNPACDTADNGTTYQLRITNIAPKPDNFSLLSDLVSASPLTGWRVSFSGPAVQGQETARLQGGESSLLKVRVIPPPGVGSGSATMRIRLQSQSSPDQRSDVNLVTEINNVRLRDIGVFLFPDDTLKEVRRGETKTFNFSIWNRGTDKDFFTVKCDKGANHDLAPDTGLRVDESWNGELRLDADRQQCRESDPGKVLTTVISPGDAVIARVTLVAGFNVTGAGRQLEVEVVAQSQGDPEKDASATVTAVLLERSSFRMFILDGSNPSLPFSESGATRVLRYGKDDSAICPNPATNGGNDGGCTGNETDVPFTGDQDALADQKLDTEFAEFAFYLIKVTNDGDRAETLTLSLNRVSNITLTAGVSGCNNRPNSFDLTRQKDNSGAYGMGEPGTSGVALITQPRYDWPLDPADLLTRLRVEPGQSSVFYLRVHNEWNRANITAMVPGSSLPVVCDAQSTVEVGAKSTVDGGGAAPFPSRSVTATTQALNKANTDAAFTINRNIIMTAGARCGVPTVDNTSGCKNQDGSLKPPELFSGEEPQNCPPVTPATGPNKQVCKYVAPGETQDWFFTVDRVTPTGDEFFYQPLRGSAGSPGITELTNLGWRFEGPFIVQDLKCPGVTSGGCNEPRYNDTASGGEAVVRVRVTVPGNATISDFSGLQLRVSLRYSGTTENFDFFTIGAQKFGVKAKNLFGDEPVVVHHGERAAVSLNVTNTGAIADLYSIDIALPQDKVQGGWTFFTPSNLTRVSPGTNKTVVVFFQSPTSIPCTPDRLPEEVKGTITVRSTLNKTRTADTQVEVPYTVVARPCGADDLKVESWNPDTNEPGLATRPIRPGGGLPFTLKLTNPAPNEKSVAMVRVPTNKTEFIDGWHDTFGTQCIVVGGRNSTFVSYTVRAPPDALNGTFATYMVYAIESNPACETVDPPLSALNFAQVALSATVIGESAVQLEPLGVVRCGDQEKIPVIPRASCADFSVRVRNIGNSEDIFVFQPKFLNQSQALPPDPWSVDIRANPDDPQCPSETEVIHSLRVPAFVSCIIFLHVSAPLNIPQTGVSSLIDLVATGTRATGEQATSATRITAFVQDYNIRLLVRNRTVDAAPGQTLFFTLNITNAGNGPDTLDTQVDIGGLAGFWNVTTNLPTEGLRLLNGTSKDVQITVQVPRVRADSAPTSGAVVGITVRSKQVEDLRPLAEALGAGSSLTQYLVSVAKTELVTVNLFPFVSIDVDDDKELELALDRNKNPADGFESFTDPFTAIRQSVDILAADGDGDGRIDHFVDIDLDGQPDRYWDPDGQILTDVRQHPDLNGDGTLEFLYDSDDDLAIDHWIDPSTRQSGQVIERDYDNDGGPEYLVDTDADGRPDHYFDPDRGPRGLVTTVRATDDPQKFSIDTNGDGRHDTTYNRVTGEVTANVFGVAEFLQNYWWVVFLFLAVVVVAGYLVFQRYRKPPGEEAEEPPAERGGR